MNVYTVIILAALIIEFILGFISDLLNLRALKTKLPDEFRDVFDKNRYEKSQRYTRVNIRFGWISGTFSLILILIFWFAGGFNVLDQWIRQFGLSPVWNGLIFIGILMLLRFVVTLPFSIYETFVIEEHFGFNKVTPRIFISDILKSLMLLLLLGAPLLAGILAFLQYAGPGAWLYCWGAAALFTLFVQFIAPTWIMPLFNKFTPLEDGALKKAILDYTRKVKYQLSGIYVMDGSKRSSKSNAFFTGFGKHRRIALFDTLIEKHNTDELVAVLAHEIGHFKKKHVITGIIISIIHMGLVFYLLSVFLSHRGLFDAFHMQEMSVYAGLLFFGLLFSPMELILGIGLGLYSRYNEHQADHFAVTSTGAHEPMISALKKLSADNLSNLTPHPFYAFLNYSHPPVLQRIKKIRRIVLP